MSGTRWHLAAALLMHLALVVMVVVSIPLNHYRVETCEVGLFSVSFALPIPPVSVHASSSFSEFRSGMCGGYAVECSHLCTMLGRVELAGLIYLIIASIAVALLLVCLLHLIYLNCVRPIALTNAYLLHVGATLLYVLSGFLSFLISSALTDPGVSLLPGAYLVIACMSTALVTGAHYAFLRSRGFWGLSKLKYTELEGTHVA